LKPITECHLYGILDLSYVSAAKAADTARQMLEGGVDILQIRAKKLGEADIARLAGEVLPLTRRHGVPLIINDHPALVRETGADGAHVGQDDISVATARELSGAGAIVGKSTHSLAQAVAGAGEGPDYIGFGPLFATPTKPDYTPIGMDDIAEAHRAVDIPIFCIGGIKLENLREVAAAGARRVVIVSGILQADDIGAYCRKCLAILGR
jgi:thiamine-phosphate pyrophosphorylase